MSTYRQVVYLVLDMFKERSDDANYTPEHIMFLLDKYRAYVLETKAKNNISNDNSLNCNYQTIDLDLEYYTPTYGDTAFDEYVRSVNEIPSIAPYCTPIVYGTDYLNGHITFVDNRRFHYVGNNKYTKNFIYCTRGDDGRLYLKSCNPDFSYLKNVKLSAIFDSSLEAAKLQKDKECDVLDMEFPVEEAYVPLIVDYIVKELSQAAYRPEDRVNNASDDLSGLIVRGDNYGRYYNR